MKNSRYKECQDCKKVFMVSVLLRQFDTLFCRFCGSANVANISRQQYLDARKKMGTVKEVK